MEETQMISKIMENGFMALAAYAYVFTLISLVLFVVAVVANAFLKNSRFDVAEIRKLFMTNLTCMAVFALLDYFLV
jgi:cbb3-type cytochrome oxidase subunit 3